MRFNGTLLVTTAIVAALIASPSRAALLDLTSPSAAPGGVAAPAAVELPSVEIGNPGSIAQSGHEVRLAAVRRGGGGGGARRAGGGGAFRHGGGGAAFRGGGAYRHGGAVAGGGFRHGGAVAGGGFRHGGAVAGGGAWRGGGAVVRRPVMIGGVWRPYGATWRAGGAIAAGAAIGFVGAATAAAWAGAPPQAGYCWYYTDASQQQGFWDVCP
jgi:hypothetical protein